jgi:hypothetical protein
MANYPPFARYESLDSPIFTGVRGRIAPVKLHKPILRLEGTFIKLMGGQQHCDILQEVFATRTIVNVLCSCCLILVYIPTSPLLFASSISPKLVDP